METIKFIDLFCGIGGFYEGLKQTGKNYECVYSNEWDRFANSVYRRHFGECDNRDIRTVSAESLPDFDLLCGGFPCQSFSIAGKRGGFNDTRGTLFFDIARILKAKQPRLCLLENVKGLLSHDHGRTFKTIISTLTELGYDCQWQVLNSKNFGVPQNRERVFVVGHLRGTRRPEVFPLGQDGDISENTDGADKTQSQTAYSRPIRATIHAMKSDDMFIRETQKLSDALRVRRTDGNAVTLKGLGGGLGAKTGLYAVEELIPYGNSQDQKISVGVSQTLSAGHYNQPKVSDTISYAIDSNYHKGINSGSKGGKSSFEKSRRQTVQQLSGIRRLTPVECERLQGFDDGWTEFGASGEHISDTQRYKMAGNAVTVNVITEIGKRLWID